MKAPYLRGHPTDVSHRGVAWEHGVHCVLCVVSFYVKIPTASDISRWKFRIVQITYNIIS